MSKPEGAVAEHTIKIEITNILFRLTKRAGTCKSWTSCTSAAVCADWVKRLRFTPSNASACFPCEWTLLFCRPSNNLRDIAYSISDRYLDAHHVHAKCQHYGFACVQRDQVTSLTWHDEEYSNTGTLVTRSRRGKLPRCLATPAAASGASYYRKSSAGPCRAPNR